MNTLKTETNEYNYSNEGQRLSFNHFHRVGIMMKLFVDKNYSLCLIQ